MIQKRFIFKATVEYRDSAGTLCVVSAISENLLDEFLLPQRILDFIHRNGYRLELMGIKRIETSDKVFDVKTVDEVFPLDDNPRFQCAIKLDKGENEPWIVRGAMTFKQIESMLNFIPIPTSQRLLVNIGNAVFTAHDRVRPIHSNEDVAFNTMIGSMPNTRVEFVVWP